MRAVVLRGCETRWGFPPRSGGMAKRPCATGRNSSAVRPGRNPHRPSLWPRSRHAGPLRVRPGNPKVEGRSTGWLGSFCSALCEVVSRPRVRAPEVGRFASSGASPTMASEETSQAVLLLPVRHDRPSRTSPEVTVSAFPFARQCPVQLISSSGRAGGLPDEE